MSVIYYHKEYLETLGQMLERFYQEYPEYRSSPVTYAGRLDPLAEGLMILLTDNDVHEKDRYSGAKKIYEVDCVLGLQTDTYDLLGRITDIAKQVPDISKEELEGVFKQHIGVREIAYPPFSSKPVQGKPLWKWYREGKEDTITIPTHQECIEHIEILTQGSTSISRLLEQQDIILNNIQGDFRQDILKRENKRLHSIDNDLPTMRLRLYVHAGTYVRSFVDSLGRHLGCGAVSRHIYRKHIGDYYLTKK
jgi:tRNA pseudouridine(55) synthase